MRWAHRDGFTLIELLVVILIIGILVAVSAPSFLGQTRKANDIAAKQQLAIAYRAAAAYAVDGNGAPGHVQGTYDGFDAAVLNASEPELNGHDNATCPDDAYGQPHNEIYIAQASGNNLVMCADPNGRVWTLRVVNGVLQPFGLPDSAGDGSNGTGEGAGSGGSGGDNGGGNLGDCSGADPANDCFEGAMEISGVSGSATVVDSTNATLQTGNSLPTGEGEPQPDPTSSCCLVHSVWYKWTAPSSGDFYFDTLGSIDTNPNSWDAGDPSCPGDVSLDTMLAAYQGDSLLTLSLIGWQDSNQTVDTGFPHCDYTSLLQLTGVQSGDVYYFQVGSYGSGDAADSPAWPAGDVHFNWHSGVAPFAPVIGDQQINSSGDIYNPAVGDVLNVNVDMSAGDEPFTFHYQWQRSIDSYNYTDIAGATTSTYTLTSADDGYAVRVKILVTNDAPGHALSYSSPVVLDPAPLPTPLAYPEITGGSGPNGSAQVGDVLHLSSGTWTSTPADYGYNWFQCSDSSHTTDCQNLTGTGVPGHSSDQDYTVKASDSSRLYFGAYVTACVSLGCMTSQYAYSPAP